MPDMSGYEDLLAEIHALDTKMRVVAQRMKIIEKNEQIIGKTLITHNKNIKALQSEIAKLKSNGRQISVAPQRENIGMPEGLEETVKAASEFKKSMKEMQDIMLKMKDHLDYNKEKLDDLREEVNEMKYVLETVNPAAYVTAGQVSDLVDEKLSRRKKK